MGEAAAGIREAQTGEIGLLLRTSRSCSPQLASPGPVLCRAQLSGAHVHRVKRSVPKVNVPANEHLAHS